MYTFAILLRKTCLHHTLCRRWHLPSQNTYRQGISYMRFLTTRP
jgi:hypothetical protein